MRNFYLPSISGYFGSGLRCREGAWVIIYKLQPIVYYCMQLHSRMTEGRHVPMEGLRRAQRENMLGNRFRSADSVNIKLFDRQINTCDTRRVAMVGDSKTGTPSAKNCFFDFTIFILFRWCYWVHIWASDWIWLFDKFFADMLTMRIN